DEVWKLLCGEQYEKLEKEFNRQVDTLVNKGFPVLTNRKEQKFREIFTPLRKHLFKLSRETFPEGHIPFIIVPSEKLLSLEKKIPLMDVEGEKGFTGLDFSDFKTAEDIKIPKSLAYILVDIENGKAMLGENPNESVYQFVKIGRSPLTAEEGIALILQYPEILKDHNIDLAGSYHFDIDYRVADMFLGGSIPMLGWSEVDVSSPQFGSASCLYRL
ncbi:MAG: hypothetical protein HYW78_02145, partial [Parcubacteria group bacterium]|nr:hypothetical protein [Parcubacteria group bacterium]